MYSISKEKNLGNGCDFKLLYGNRKAQKSKFELKKNFLKTEINSMHFKIFICCITIFMDVYKVVKSLNSKDITEIMQSFNMNRQYEQI